ncbi:hypothetical protein [Fretibacter rubidus]|uniref:hypothetical protein n=1 Tax=Fretibacter rubidus TaxID=570162 RepID=UPI00352B354F
MAIYRKIIQSPNITGPTTLTDIAGLSPMTIQAGDSNYSFLATLSISGLTIPTMSANWGVVFHIMQGSTTLGSYYMGENNGGFRPSFTMTAVGDVCATGTTEDIHVKWLVSPGLKAWIREPASFSVLWDVRL